LTLRLARRLIESAEGSVAVEPLVMKVLVTLSLRVGMLVQRRELFDACWGSAPVGDDSLNRIIAVLRKLLRQVAGDSVQIQTVASAGYVLRLNPAPTAYVAQHAVEYGRASWRRGLPEPDYLSIEQLRAATATTEVGNADAWGMLALLSRYAAEYADPGLRAAHVTQCELAATRALAVDGSQAEARVALATVAPLFGRWLEARAPLDAILAEQADSAPARHELGIIEMASGRVGRAKLLLDELIAEDPLAACYNYKSIWQHWSVGDLTGMDQVAERAVQLWPTHPAVWMARFWSFAHTQRASAAVMMIDDASSRPAVPLPMLNLLRTVAKAACGNDAAEIDQAIRDCLAAGNQGPANAVAALLGLGLFEATDAAFQLAEAYYFRSGPAPVPARHVTDELSINDQHRRVTQPLFTPAGAHMRLDARFAGLCERIGLADYWERGRVKPDYLIEA
jgi:tetratricopeptide (TPR) repeat protein